MLLREGTPFTARIPAHVQPRRGDRLALAARPERFHYFDVETGERINRRSPTADGAAAARAASGSEPAGVR